MENQLSAQIAMVGAIAEAIRTLGSVPSGHFYAQVCHQMDLQTYTSIIGVLKRAELVSEAGHVLTWVGSKVE